MIALEVFVNDHRICLNLAGVGNDGVLNANVNWVGRPNYEEEIYLHVGGLDCITDESLRSNVLSIRVGAEMLVKFVDADSVDRPGKRVPLELPTTLGKFPACLQEFMEQLTLDERQQLPQGDSREIPIPGDGPIPGAALAGHPRQPHPASRGGEAGRNPLHGFGQPHQQIE